MSNQGHAGVMNKIYILYCLLLLLCVLPVACGQPANVILTSTFNNSLTLAGPYINNATKLSPFPNYTCTVNASTIVTDACKIEHNRTEATLALQAFIGGPDASYYVTTDLCEIAPDNETTCVDGDNIVLPCPPLTASSMCTYMRAYMRLEGNTSPECNSVNDISLIGYACGETLQDQQTHFCATNNTCIDARFPECITTLECILDQQAPSQPAMFLSSPLSAIYVLQYPNVASICTPVSCQLPITVTPVTPISLTFQQPLPNDTDIAVYATSIGDIMLNVTYFGAFGAAAYTFNLGQLAVYTPNPLLFSLCPSLMLADVNTTIVVQGSGFFAGPMLACFFDGQSVPVVFLDTSVLHCNVVIRTNKTGNYPITVSNDGGATFASTVLYVTVLGTCPQIKPNSIPVGDSCECPAGFMDVSGSACVQCGAGTYQSEIGQSTCLPCDSTRDTGGLIGSKSIDACVCKAGYYDEMGTCVSCTIGMDCTKGGGQVGVLAGYWRASANDTYAVTCPGGAAWCSGGFGAGDQLCSVGYTSPLCSSCAVGFGSFNNKCYSCGQQAVNIVVVMMIVLLCLVAVFTMAYFSFSEGNDVYGESINIGPVAKIIFTHLQSLYYIGQINCGWAATSRGFFVFFVPLSISTSFLSIKCAFEMSFYLKMTLVMIEPLLVFNCMVVVIMVINVVLSRLGKYAFTYTEGQGIVLISLYLVHPSIALDILQSLSCTSVRGTGTSFVTTDMRIDCGSHAYGIYRAIAVTYFLCYIIAGALYVAYNVSINRTALAHIRNSMSAHHNDPETKFVYFFQGYRAGKYASAWEIVIMTRKLAIVAASALLPPVLGLVWATFVLFTCFLLTSYKMPYLPNTVSWILDLNNVDSVSLAAQLTTLLLAFHSLYYSKSDSAVNVESASSGLFVRRSWYLCFLLLSMPVRLCS